MRNKKWIGAGIVALAFAGQGGFAETAVKTSSTPKSQAASEGKSVKGSGSLDLTSQKAQLSYAIGSNVGGQLKRDFDADPLDGQVMAQGMKDQLEGRESQLSTEQMVKVFQEQQKGS